MPPAKAAPPAVRRARAAKAPAKAPAPRKRPATRAPLKQDPDPRDWADTGDPDYEPDPPPRAPARSASARPARPVAARPVAARPAPARPAPAPYVEHWKALPEDETVIFARPSGFPAVQPELPRPASRPAGPPRRAPMIVQGLWPALLAGALVAAASAGVLPLAAAVFGVQVFLILGALALLDAPAAGGGFLIATLAAVAADAVILLGDGGTADLAGVAGAGFVVSLAHQLARRNRSRVTEALADTLVVLVVAVAASCLLALLKLEGGEPLLQISLASAGAVLLAGRLGDWLTPRPELAVGSTRGWPGLLLGLGAGVAAATLVADLAGEPPLQAAVLLGLVVATTVATADLAVDLGAAELRSGWRDARRVAALRPTALLLPFAVLGPVALLAARLLMT